jgi:hypothetical protein
MLTVRRLLTVLCLICSGAVLPASSPESSPVQEQAPQGQALVEAALANEVRAAQDLSHPMRFVFRKSSSRVTSTQVIYETRDGNVARLMLLNDKPLNAIDEQKEAARLAELANDPGRQRHRKQAGDNDRARVAKVVKALPGAFLFEDQGPAQAASGPVEKFSFRPNPAFNPPDIETQALTACAGEIWIDPAQQRVVRLDGHLLQDVDFGWGILGRLYKGGWIRIDQSEIGEGQWRIVRFQMGMSARVVWRTRAFETLEEESQFVPLPTSLSYVDAIKKLQGEQQPVQ